MSLDHLVVLALVLLCSALGWIAGAALVATLLRALRGTTP